MLVRDLKPRPPGYCPIVITISSKLNDALAICIKSLIVNILDLGTVTSYNYEVVY